MHPYSVHLTFHVQAVTPEMAHNKVFALLVKVKHMQERANSVPAHFERPVILLGDPTLMTPYLGRYKITYPLPDEHGEKSSQSVNFAAKFVCSTTDRGNLQEAFAAVAQVFDKVIVPDVQLVKVEQSIVNWGP